MSGSSTPRAADTAVFEAAPPAARPLEGRDRRAAWLSVAVGLALFTGLLTWQGIGDVARALATAGAGLLLVPLAHLPPLVADAMGWRRLLRRGGSPSVRTMVFARWIGESVNGLLPVLQVGGNVAKARVLTRRGVPLDAAGASVVVDVTLVMLSQAAFTLLGMALLVRHLGGRALLPVVLTGFGLTAAMLLAFFVVQRAGLFVGAARILAALGRRGTGDGVPGGATALDAAVRRLHGDGRALGVAGLWHAASWLLGTAEVAVALELLGHPLDLSGVLLLESLGQAVRAGAFAVPAALGVQEGAFLLLGASVGLAPHTALALSLVRRGRDLLLGLPGLVAWQLDAARDAARRGV